MPRKGPAPKRPLVVDPVYGYQVTNVEAQQRHPSSLLHWVQSMMEVRKQHPVFGTGTFEALDASNPKVLSFLREDSNQHVLVVAHLGATAQFVELDLTRFAGWQPVELLGGTPFPRIGELSYLLTMTGRGFYWFDLLPPEE